MYANTQNILLHNNDSDFNSYFNARNYKICKKLKYNETFLRAEPERAGNCFLMGSNGKLSDKLVTKKVFLQFKLLAYS